MDGCAIFLNILWFILGGEILCLTYGIVGILCCISIIGAPIGVGLLRVAGFAAFPFGKALYRPQSPYERSGCAACMNVFWMIFIGWWMAIMFFIVGAICCCTIIGIPFGLGYFNLAKLSFRPFNVVVCNKEDLMARYQYQAPASVMWYNAYAPVVIL
ncbi:hypothetical protein KIPB_002537 [Kipferlia bialata]|uniref:Inner membrane component domain-containing protein n=1 Tax=Kipferlia bialata TaxID=797122 RepID=A0A9K3CRW2_9EUKA|nr:hypothetical protein KIPB_002537 [Kipferlia bialata]|eukprot:g2537.t1